ncbi:MAG: M28 family peptidase [Hyphomonadaceae bacterium]|nr:M28 family peptidase [Hyphomonadaceae bacterium]
MKFRFAAAVAAFALAACASADQHAAAPAAPPVAPAFAYPPLSPEALLAHVNVLASDEFEGRAPGTEGERRTIEYLTRTFAAAGLQPGVTLPDGTRSWTQETQLVSAQLTNTPTLTISGRDGARAYQYATQFSAWTRRLDATVDIANAPLVFVGYGINAPELGWNDYAGVDMHGKIAVILINDPDFETGDDRGFGGRAMTYYGRWTYKFEEAGRQGAAGAIIIHETAGAAYPWAVIQSATGSPRWDIVREDRGASRAGFEGWMNNDVAMETFRRAHLDLNELKARAQRRGFRAVRMNLNGSLHLETDAQVRTTSNVIGVLPGRSHPNETVIYSAHWDHLGHCPPVDGDDICNGALDNATGTSALIELARRFSAQGQPERSVAFIALTSEEQGLLGALYYSQHPVFAPRDTVAAINMDGINNFGPTRDFEIVGYGKSEMDDLLVEALGAQGRRVAPDSSPEAGYFYRSDHLHFAQIGIPVLYTSSGIDMVDGGEARGRALSDAYTANNYHKPSDEVTPDWNMTGGAQDLEALYAVGRRLADGEEWPQWRANAEFRAAREASGR